VNDHELDSGILEIKIISTASIQKFITPALARSAGESLKSSWVNHIAMVDK
jgi:hypothetical protein